MSNLPPISGLLGPVVGLNIWTFVMETWMYAVTIPEYGRLNLQNTTPKGQVDLKMDPKARWKRDNYNHLLEQPTQFYAIALTLALARAGKEQRTDVMLAWAYVGVRIVHSLVHCSKNVIPLRFGLFVASSGILGAMTARAARLVFGI